jgi:hypothetical protein
MIQMAFTSAVKAVTDEVSKQLKAKDQSETAQYILLYGKYEDIVTSLGPQVERLLKTAEYTFGGKEAHGSRHQRSRPCPYIQQYHSLFNQLAQAYIKCREPVGPLVSKNLRQFASSEPKPEIDFQLFARRCVIHVFDVCHNELKLTDRFFFDGPLLTDYSDDIPLNAAANYAEQLEQNRLSHVKTLYTFLTPYLINGDLHRVCDLINWLESMYPVATYKNPDARDTQQNAHRSTALFLLSEHLWPLCDSLFIKAASEFQHYKPSVEDLTIGASPSEELKKSDVSQKVDADIEIAHDPQTPAHSVSTAYPTVKTAVRLLIMYNEHNESTYDRPVS